MVKIAVLVSGGGTNFQALIDAEKAGGIPDGKIALCVSSSKNAYALTRAAENGIEAAVLRPRDFESRDAYAEALLRLLREKEIGLVVLAGFLVILPEKLIEAYRGRIVNVHPSLIPSFCGEGFYGLKVHEAALSYGVRVTGATVHLVSEVVDGGRILYQKAVEVKAGDTPETLQRRVMEEAEWKLLPLAVADLCRELSREEKQGLQGKGN
ncbi:MAG TPA: phosphoribosylglycinamide formyltransferase [Candidatus Fimivivens faecavium]|nr:phosphoribosylglycinamide formyltransferase [Candidatus Fimivivens faecavium]